MLDYSHVLARNEFRTFRQHFEDRLAERANPQRHGDLPTWLDILGSLPIASPSQILLNAGAITIGAHDDLTPELAQQLEMGLKKLSPWRKGPYQVFNSYIDTEWRSDWKWNRVQPHISDLSGRKVLDVGCGTGYHCWRMLGDGAEYVLGIDPSMRFQVQYLCIQKYINDNRFDFLPIGIEDMPNNMPLFDTAFSMGVLYHRRNPINHLVEMKNLMAPGGELVLETLIIDDLIDGIFTPKDRYAKMRNVWSIMTVEKISALLEQAGFHDIRCVDTGVTSLSEQRSTEWMSFHSLEQFLDPLNHTKTIEGYPAPKRGIFIANKAP